MVKETSSIVVMGFSEFLEVPKSLKFDFSSFEQCSRLSGVLQESLRSFVFLPSFSLFFTIVSCFPLFFVDFH